MCSLEDRRSCAAAGRRQAVWRIEAPRDPLSLRTGEGPSCGTGSAGCSPTLCVHTRSRKRRDERERRRALLGQLVLLPLDGELWTAVSSARRLLCATVFRRPRRRAGKATAWSERPLALVAIADGVPERDCEGAMAESLSKSRGWSTEEGASERGRAICCAFDGPCAFRVTHALCRSLAAEDISIPNRSQILAL